MTSETFTLSFEDQSQRQSHALPRVDGGRAAIMNLVGCSILQLSSWGFVMSYGVLQEQYTTHFNMQGSSKLTGAIGTTLNGVLYMSLPIISTLLAGRLYQWRRMAAILGLLISSASLVISASSTAAWHLLVTQGILCGLGSALLYSPSTLQLNEWWVRRKSFAYGVTLAAKNIVGTGTPYLNLALLGRLGLQNTLRVWGVITFVSGILALPLMHQRGEWPTNQQYHHYRRRTPWKFLTHPTFYVFHIGNIIFSSGYGLPQTYLPSYASQILHRSQMEGSLMLALFNLPGIFSCVAFGILGDGTPLIGAYKPTPFTTTFLSAIGAALPVFFIWGLAAQSGLVGLALFSVTYGFFASAYSATWGGALREIEREAVSHNEPIDTGVVYGLLNGGRGLGYVLGGVAGIELLKTGAVRKSSLAYGTEYGSVILYTGISSAIGGLSVFWNLAGRRYCISERTRPA
ncbi:putative monocarboxylate transporter [Talaromyces proteolyticus]|uniref:Monocarboxylate transporter n=1 Tax=Talaromyces proteolyticus TaxID=1131652 RepID=A0AAD4KXK9_9EURO|nr:putative monocarboxylate transporter [Talaromyces proteolyticus]KAH8699022.1 putative monocarboxylate transporter [Talaromyces proteolyticus]